MEPGQKRTPDGLYGLKVAVGAGRQYSQVILAELTFISHQHPKPIPEPYP